MDREIAVDAMLGSVANELFSACRGRGIDHRDFVTVVDVYYMLVGMP